MADSDAEKNKTTSNDDKAKAASARPAAKTTDTRAEVTETPVTPTMDALPVDPRLDNRTGRQRPPLEEFPAKPQQIDGPDVTEQPDRSARPHAEEDDDLPRKGLKSTGPHGLGDTADQV